MNAPPFALAPSSPHACARESTASRWGADVKRILCVRLDHMGDVLMTTPALHALRTAVPGRHLTLLTSKANTPLAPFLGDIDELLGYDAPWHGTPNTLDPAPDLAMVNALREQHFDGTASASVEQDAGTGLLGSHRH